MSSNQGASAFFNPASLAGIESISAKYWELLRRNKEFKKVSESYATSANFRNNHHNINHWSGCCLYWMIKPKTLRKIDKENTELKFWRPDMFAKRETPKPLAIGQSWPNTNSQFRSALVNVIGDKRFPKKIDLSLSSFDNLNGESALTKVFQLNRVNQSYFVVGIPRGHYKQQELRNLLDDVGKLYRKEHLPPPDTRKPGYLGSVEEWDAFLLVESEGDLNSACIERLTSKVKEKEGRSLKPGEAETAYAKHRDSITKQKKRIDHLICRAYSRTQVNTLIEWDAISLGVYFYFGKKSGPFRSSNRAFQKIMEST
jgi:hypothetical protein